VTQTLVDLFNHNLWANVRIIEACSELSTEDLAAAGEGMYGSIGDTLVHFLASEGRYVAEIKKQPPEIPLAEGDAPDFDVLRRRVEMSGRALIEIATETEAESKISGVFRGQPYEMRAVFLLGQAINHATEHRIHISAILTQRGINPPRTDFIAFWMETESG
jgi:uncharacterized damage-inducible protein DinB